MKIKTAEATNLQLDWMVAKAEDYCPEIRNKQVFATRGSYGYFKPSETWSQGGPIIEREGINTYQMQDGTWQGNLDYGMTDELIYWGATPLIAAMRCYCCAILGDEVDVPDELA